MVVLTGDGGGAEMGKVDGRGEGEERERSDYTVAAAETGNSGIVLRRSILINLQSHSAPQSQKNCEYFFSESLCPSWHV